MDETTSTALREVPFHTSLTRPLLMMGADRELTLMNVVVCIALLFGIGFSVYTASVVFLLATIGQWGLGRVTRYDPDFRRVAVRHGQLQAFYPAAAGIHAPRPVIHAALPYSE